MREMMVTCLAVLVVLLVIMIGNVLARSLGRVTDGSIAPDMVLILVGVNSISLLVQLIPLGLYLGILLAHGRFYRDNEMAVMQACGVGWKDLLRPTAIVGLVGVTAILLLTIFASPWAARYEQVLKQQMREQSAISLLTPGKFIESTDGGAVFFVQDSNPEKTRFDNIFMVRKSEKNLPVVDRASSASYRRDEASGNEYLVLSDGQTSIGRAGSTDYTVTEFNRQGVLRPREDAETPRLRTKGKTVSQLIGTDDLADKAELQWRISIPLAALLLALLAVPLSYTSPREGRFGKIAVAILIYIPYANLLVLMRKWISSGTVPAWIGLWPVHLLVAGLIVTLLIRRVGWTWLTSGRGRHGATPAHTGLNG